MAAKSGATGIYAGSTADAFNADAANGAVGASEDALELEAEVIESDCVECASGAEDGEGDVESAAGNNNGSTGSGESSGDDNGSGTSADDDSGQAPIEVELTVAKKLASDMHDKYMRLQAEWDNFRKRTASEREQERIRASEKLVVDLLPVLDDLDRAIDHAKESGEGGTLTDGVEAIRTKFLNILAKSKVQEIEALMQPLDLEKHQAVGTQDDSSVPEETVVQVFQKGYVMGEKVLRPAMVITSKGGAPRPKEEN